MLQPQASSDPVTAYSLIAGPGAGQSSFDFDCLLEPARKAARVGPRIVRSITEDAGLQGFIYLEGASTRRYIFSRIKQQQAGLYRNAVFALTGISAEPVCVGSYSDLSSNTHSMPTI